MTTEASTAQEGAAGGGSGLPTVRCGEWEACVEDVEAGRRGASVQWCTRADSEGSVVGEQLSISRRWITGENTARPWPGRQRWRSSATPLLRAL